MKSNDIFGSIKNTFIKHEPEILMGLGLSGMIFSTIWGIKATAKAIKKIDIRKKELQKEKLTFKETFKVVWPLYLPVVISTGLSIPSIIMSNRVSAKRNTILTAAYVMSEKALNEYKEQTKQIVGERKEKEITEKVSEKIVQDTYNKNDIIMIGDGDCLFHEPISGRYFKSNWNKILKAANELNAKSISSLNGIITLTDWYDELGLDKTKLSDSMAWKLEDGKDGIITITINACLTPDKVPCGSISYDVLPKPW